MHLAGVWAGALAGTTAGRLPTSDYFIPQLVQRIMPVGLAGIFLAAPMAAVMSTADSLLLLATAAIIRDLWKGYGVGRDAARQSRYRRHFPLASSVVTLALGVLTVLLALHPPQIIFFLNLFALGGLECSFFWPLVGGLFWREGNRYAALSSSVGAAATYLWCHFKVHWLGIHAVVWGLLAGGVLYFTVGRLTRRRCPVDAETLEQCF